MTFCLIEKAEKSYRDVNKKEYHFVLGGAKRDERKKADDALEELQVVLGYLSQEVLVVVHII